MKPNLRLRLALVAGPALLLSGGLAVAAPAAGEAPPATAVYRYEQRVFGAPEPLLSSARSQAALARFREAYARLGRPRLAISVNPPRQGVAAEAPSLADQQTRRDVERLFGRPLRLAGATLIDHNAGAADGAQPAGSGEVAAPAVVADVVIEVLISSRQVPYSADGAVATVPDIQATAVRVGDKGVLGQAAASDLLGVGIAAGEKARTYSTEEIVEATALVLIEDMALATENPR